MTRLDRRQTLALMTGTALTSACTVTETPPALESVQDTDEFRHGVASGDPDTTSVVLWTRVTTNADFADVTWTVFEDADTTSEVSRGTVRTDAERDFTVKLVAVGLQPGRTYYYRFQTGNARSRTGRTKTLPVGHVDQLGIALASCSNYPFGYFNAYDALAKDAAIDIVLHTGDYIYEYGGPDGWGAETGTVLDRPHDPPHEIVTLADYRRRHAQYKSDPGSRAMHAAHPFVCCWDDHESANNPWKDGAQNHQPESEGDWTTRRVASIRAYYEWMPIREPVPGRTRAEFWRAYVFGDLATLATLETRHTARGQQVDYAEWGPRLKTEEDNEAFRQDVIGDPDRKMLSPELEADIGAALSHSVATRQPWRIIGNPMPLARNLVPDLVGLGVLPAPDENAIDAHTRLAWLGAHGLPFYTDTWDGYPAAREAFYNLCKANGASDLLVLTGDSHSFWANRLFDDLGAPMGVEFGTAGITSPGDFVESGFGDDMSRRLDSAFAEHMPEVAWTDNMHQGYVRIVLTPESGRADIITVSTVLSPLYTTRTLRSFDVTRVGDSLTLEPA